MTKTEKRRAKQREYSRRYRAKHEITETEREKNRARWLRWYDRNPDYQRSHAAPKSLPKPALITAEMVRDDERRRVPPIRPASRPKSGVKCACGKVLYSYEIRLGKCLHCVKVAAGD